MALENELKLNKPIDLLPREVLVTIIHTATCIKKEADKFLGGFDLTSVQFNVLMLLRHQCGSDGGLNQVRLSEMMLVNRANITTLIDRMEKGGLVKRTGKPNDRRHNIVQLTDKGSQFLDKVEPLYRAEIKNRLAAFSESKQKQLIDYLEEIRTAVVS